MRFEIRYFLALPLVCTICAFSAGAELRIRSDAHPQGTIVHLGDVADIFDADESQIRSLAQIELMPAPPPGKQRQISVREIQDTLERRGLNLLQCHFSGASQVTVAAGADAPRQTAKTARTIPLTSIQEAQRAVADAIAQYLHQQTSSDDPWNVAVELTSAQAQTILVDVHHVDIRGGQAPWVGKQSFEVQVRSDKGPASFTVSAQVTLPESVVATTKDVPCGAIIQTTDVTLQRLKPGAQVGDAFTSLDDVVGQEAILAIAPGQILDPQYVHSPVMVKRGSVITVYSVAPGIKIRTTGRCREDGSRNQMVMVEALLDRKTFQARVTGFDQVEVNADAATAPDAVADGEPGANVARKTAAKARLAMTHPVQTSAASDNNGDLETR
jgi:flagella basal body P-ring formation protein FlgA